jgi:CxxC-x17-CxxC domain-containing protein
MFTDKTLTCIDCGGTFVFTAGEQQFFHEKHFTNSPRRCKPCKKKQAGGGRAISETSVTCAECGEQTTVPFKPKDSRPVLCRACFQGAKAMAQ